MSRNYEEYRKYLEEQKRRCRERGKIWFMNSCWSPINFIMFWLGIVGFIVGLLIVILFSTPKQEILGTLLSIISIIISLMSATRDQIERLEEEIRIGFNEMRSRFENLEKRFENLDKRFESTEIRLQRIENVLKEIRDELRRRSSL